MNPTKPILCLGCFFATAALAQPDVQLYGKVDLAVQYTKNPGKDAVVNLQNETSRWGLLIREDLNADWAVKAYLEAGQKPQKELLLIEGASWPFTTKRSEKSASAEWEPCNPSALHTGSVFQTLILSELLTGRPMK